MIEAFEGELTVMWAEPVVWIPAVSMTIGGLITVIVCVVLLRRRRRFRDACTATVPGIVSEVREDYDNDGTLWSPVFSYTVDGRDHTLASGTWSRPARFKEGDAVTVHYDPFQPDHAWVKEDRGGTILLFAFLAAGSLNLIVGLVWPFLWSALQ